MSSERDFFLYWYESSQIRGRYLGWSSYNTQAVISQVNIGCQTLTVFIWKCHFNLMLFAISTFLCRFLIRRWHRRFSSSHASWNASFCVTNKLIHIFQKQRSCHNVLFIECKRNECVSKLHNFFSWIFYKSANLCCL